MRAQRALKNQEKRKENQEKKRLEKQKIQA
jgi:hypothetical protein